MSATAWAEGGSTPVLTSEQAMKIRAAKELNRIRREIEEKR